MGVDTDNIAPKSHQRGYQAKVSWQGSSKEKNRLSHANQRTDGAGLGQKNLSNNLSDEKEDSAPRSIRRDINIDELRELQNSINSMNVVTNYTVKYLIALECAGNKYIPLFGEEKFSLYNCDQFIKPSSPNVNNNGNHQKRNESNNIYQNTKMKPIENFQRVVRKISDDSQLNGETDSKPSRPLKLKSAFVKAISSSSRRITGHEPLNNKNSRREYQLRRSTAPHITSSEPHADNNNPIQDVKARPPRPRRGFFKRDTDSESVGGSSIKNLFYSSLRNLKEEVDSDDDSIMSSISFIALETTKKPTTESSFKKEPRIPSVMSLNESYSGFIRDSSINDYFYEN